MKLARLRARTSTRAHRDGSAAVEFALVAFPFFFMIFAVMEIGLIFITDSILDNAALDAGRMVRTGQVAGDAMTKAQLKDALCSRMSVFSAGCAERTVIDLQTLTRFRDAPDDPTSGEAPTDANTQWDRGNPESLMVFRVWYRQPLFTPFLAQALDRSDDGSTRLTATVPFRNEPYQ